MTDNDFLAAFEAGTLPGEAFDHRAHLRLAWLYLRRLPQAQAEAAVCAGIQGFAERLGAADKFHLTLTMALVRLVAAAPLAPSFEAFLAGSPALLADAKGLLAQHYSAELLASLDARHAFLGPDLAPLP
ncbi:hypothetical protein PVT67_16155 [Gallaecimonas kandeliae]|uniref:hypothetical protein n=1 Tax=Gallaecimonas kandeliae TaxID=3029055 RepID=UPI0026492AFF|nr:hypothetical protein [Gallaecimonas kandeliae]WKE65176.1 hypothetical protein PVT67_16155 [Gallaecimonas kandeliae]